MHWREFMEGVDQCVKRVREGKLAIDTNCLCALVRANCAAAARYVQGYCIMAQTQPSYLRMALIVAAAVKKECGDDAPLKMVEDLADDLEVREELMSIGVAESFAAAAAEPPERAAAREWWEQTDKTEGICDGCRVPLKRGAGYLVSGRSIMVGEYMRFDMGDELLCADCFDKLR